MENYPTSAPISRQKPTVNSVFDQRARDNFAIKLKERHPRVSAYLDQPFGKENLLQTFT